MHLTRHLLPLSRKPVECVATHAVLKTPCMVEKGPDKHDPDLRCLLAEEGVTSGRAGDVGMFCSWRVEI